MNTNHVSIITVFLFAFILLPVASAADIGLNVGVSLWMSDWNRETDDIAYDGDTSMLWGPSIGVTFGRLSAWGYYYTGDFDLKMDEYDIDSTAERTDLELQLRYRLLSFLHAGAVFKQISLDSSHSSAGGVEVDDTLNGLGLGLISSYVIPNSPVYLFGNFIYFPDLTGDEDVRDALGSFSDDLNADGYNGELGAGISISAIRTFLSLSYRFQKFQIDTPDRDYYYDDPDEDFGGVKLSASVAF